MPVSAQKVTWFVSTGVKECSVTLLYSILAGMHRTFCGMMLLREPSGLLCRHDCDAFSLNCKIGSTIQ